MNTQELERYMIPIQPATKDYIWGGQRLRLEYGKQADSDMIAESWEFSCHPDGESRAALGVWQGSTLAQLVAQQPGLLGSGAGQQCPLLVKLIDAQSDLSVQVHPNDDYARAHEGDNGKTEMWYVLEAQPDATLVYGVNKTVTRAQLADAAEQGSLMQHLRTVQVKAGDVFFIEAGMLHAIGGGIVIAEVQQSSNVTYRVYDYNRTDAAGNKRPLHLQKALEVAELTPTQRVPGAFGTPQQVAGGSVMLLAACSYFTVRLLAVTAAMQLVATPQSFHHLLVVAGSAQVCCGSTQYTLQKGQSIFIPAGLGAYTVHGNATILQSSVEQEM